MSDPEHTDEGIEMYVDCSLSLEPIQGETYRRILIEEIQARGLRAVSLSVPSRDRVRGESE